IIRTSLFSLLLRRPPRPTLFPYTTLFRSEGLSALAMARAHMPDLILMDIQLPEISGLEVTKWLKDDEALAHIPVIAVTAFAMKRSEEHTSELQSLTNLVCRLLLGKKKARS